uniref:Uncharacterized protein n=1 Tax=Arion vulgaris TaxID=1028688 RepID=A0A0B6ZIQ0_9EUPU
MSSGFLLGRQSSMAFFQFLKGFSVRIRIDGRHIHKTHSINVLKDKAMTFQAGVFSNLFYCGDYK